MIVSLKKSAVILLSVATALVAFGITPANGEECLTTSQKGLNSDFYYSFWTDSPGAVIFCLQGDGRYTSQWNGVNSWVGGKGWQIGSRRIVSYSGSFDSSSGHLSLYGWTTDPLVEYYIVESWGTYRPPGEQGFFMGTMVSDAGTYDVYRAQRFDAPSLLGNTDTFDQYWSVRQEKRRGGTITTANHFDTWQSLGMNLGAHNLQIMATEGSSEQR